MTKRTFTVYMLRCSDDSLYTGMTSNLEQRFQEHESGKYPDSYTHELRPVELVFTREFDNTHDAIMWERKIKGWSRKKKEALIKEDWETIQKLAKKKNFKRKR